MNLLISFLLGGFFGGFTATTMMCLMAIAKRADKDLEKYDKDS